MPETTHTPLAQVAQELAQDFGERWDREVIEACVSDSYATVAQGARITAFIPALTKRLARDRLRELSPRARAGV